jgi:hypothetical protein
MAFVSLFASVLITHSAKNGAHISPDSLTYLGSASNLAAGHGWTYAYDSPTIDIGSPLTLFPPAYPTVLAIGPRLHIDILRWALWLNAVFLALGGMAIGLVVFAETDRRAAQALIATTLFVFGAPILEVFFWLFSEVVFFPFEILAVWGAARAVRDPRRRFAAIGGGAAGLATLTRYAGIPFLATGCLVLVLWPGEGRRARLKSAAIYGAVGLAVFFPWAMRDLVRAHTVSGATLETNAPYATWSQVSKAIDVLRSPLLPPPDARWVLALIGVALACVAISVVITLRRRVGVDPVGDPRAAEATTAEAGEPGGGPADRGMRGDRLIRVAPLAWVALTYSVTYFAFIVLARAFASRTPGLVPRMFSPIYPLAVITLVMLGDAFWRAHLDARVIARAGLTLAAAGLVALAVVRGTMFISDRYKEPDRSAAALAELSKHMKIGIPPGAEQLYSNVPSVAWASTGLPARRLPLACVGNEVNPDYNAQLSEVRRSLDSKPGAVVIIVGPDTSDFGIGPGCAVQEQTAISAGLPGKIVSSSDGVWVIVPT